MYTNGRVRVVWTQLISFDLQPQIHKNYNNAHIKDMHRVMWKYSHVLRADLVSIAEQQTLSKGWKYRDLSTCLLVSRHLVISNWHGCYSPCLTICVGACVGCHSLSSGVPVQAAKVRVSPVAFQCGLFQLSFSSGIPVYPAISAGWPSGIPVYTGSTSGIPVAFQCSLDQPVYTGSG